MDDRVTTAAVEAVADEGRQAAVNFGRILIFFFAYCSFRVPNINKLVCSTWTNAKCLMNVTQPVCVVCTRLLYPPNVYGSLRSAAYALSLRISNKKTNERTRLKNENNTAKERFGLSN